MQRTLTRTILIMLAISVLQACSWYQDREPEYLDSKELDRITVPDDLDAPEYPSPLLITVREMRKPSGDELNPRPPRVTSTQGKNNDANAFLGWSARGVYLFVRDTPDSVARRLGFAIERSGMVLLEKDNANGQHRFEFVHLRVDDRGFWESLAFWRRDKGENHSGIFQTELEADGENTRVFLLFDSGEPATTDSAERILGILMERLG